MLNNQHFTQNRRTFLGGSDIGAILGLSPYRSAMDVWLEKTGKSVEFKSTLNQRFGTHAESFIAQEYARTTGATLIAYEKAIAHPRYAFCAGHIDRFIVKDSDQTLMNADGTLNAERLLECKTASFVKHAQWGEPGTDAIPLPYLCQSLWYLIVTGLPSIDVAVLLGGSELRIYTIDADHTLQNTLLEKAIFFWYEYVQKDIPPPPQSELDCQKLFSHAISDKSIEAKPAHLEMIRSLKCLEASAKSIEAQISENKQSIMQAMGDAEYLTHHGQTLVSWKAPKPSYRIDTKQLTRDHPDLAGRYQVPIQNQRRFVVRDAFIEESTHA